MKKLFSILLAAVLFVTVTAGSAAGGADSALYEAVRAQAGTDVSGFSADCLTGGKLTGEVFAQYSLCLVTYWATWSGDALRQLDCLNAIHAQRPDIGVMGILNTDSPGSVEAALQYMEAHGYDLPVITADSVWQGVISQAAVLPQTFFVSPSGIILEAFPGVFASSEQMLDEALNWVGPEGTFTVRFYDRFGGSCSIIAAYKGLNRGAYVTAPEPPMHEGWLFSGWSAGGYTYVTQNIEVFAGYTAAPIPGDVDQSGEVDALDALILLRIALGIMAAEPVHFACGDMDGNGVLNANDALIVLRKAIFHI